MSVARRPALELVAVELVRRGPGAVVEADVAEPARGRRGRVDERAQRRQADAAGDDDDVAARRRARSASRCRAARAGRARRRGPRPMIAAVAGPAAGSSARCRPAGSARSRSGSGGKAGSVDHHELAGLAGRNAGSTSPRVSVVDVRGLAAGRRRSRAVAYVAGRRGDRLRTARAPAVRRAAGRSRCSSSRTSMPDRAPGDAAAAADAAEACRTGPPRSRTCGSATGGSGPAAGSEVAAGDLREARA